MARLISFGPLQRVPSSWLNKIQDYLFGQRANGPNQSDVLLAEHDARFVQPGAHSVHRPISSVASFTLMDNQIDWRDRNIKIRWRFDDVNDIRPVGRRYPVCPGWGDATRSTQAGGSDDVPPSWSMRVDGTRQDQLHQVVGYLYVEIDSGTQLKERS